MTDSDTAVDHRPIGIIPIHFDVPEHYIPYATFDEAAAALRGAIDAFNRELYEGQLQYELLVFPSEDGSFLTRWGVRLLAGYGAIAAFTGTDFGKGFIKGLTNHTTEQVGEIVGSYAQTKILDAANAVGTALKKPTAPATRCDYPTAIITESTKSFLQTGEADLKRIGVTPRKYRDAFDTRNGFYQACAADQKVKGIGFDETDRFPIQRKDFINLQVSLPPSEDTPEPKRWQVEIININVTSPNWDRQDRKRHWKGKDGKGRDCLFQIQDEQFWSLVQTGRINPRVIDTIRVQMAFVGPQHHHARVLRVLQYNGQRLAEPLDSNALDAILGSFNAPPKDAGPDLFRR